MPPGSQTHGPASERNWSVPNQSDRCCTQLRGTCRGSMYTTLPADLKGTIDGRMETRVTETESDSQSGKTRRSLSRSFSAIHHLESKEERTPCSPASHRSGDARFSACPSRACNCLFLKEDLFVYCLGRRRFFTTHFFTPFAFWISIVGPLNRVHLRSQAYVLSDRHPMQHTHSSFLPRTFLFLVQCRGWSVVHWCHTGPGCL